MGGLGGSVFVQPSILLLARLCMVSVVNSGAKDLRLYAEVSLAVAQSRSILEHTTLTGRSIKSYSDGDNRDAALESDTSNR